ncbi:MAG TPA: N,N-dimethylformamidase beta subunit family domain-containing protein, partial [Vicinamibacterales bacterium]|nr:N,N-dimethylformamidase beta subunit family domain-containing protein [Vicinamibacterales bacterium]
MTTSPSRTFRRLGIYAAIILTATTLALQVAGHLTAQATNPIPAENQLTGNPRSEWDVTGSGDSSIQGFATDISVNKGGTISFKVTTTAASFSMNIYRLGYYQGNGARKVATISSITGRNQPACITESATGLYDCGNWTVSTSWQVPSNAVSGIYIARIASSSGASHIPFIVRDDALQADIVLQANDTTWQAYNQYGGHSLYLGTPTRGYKVSYNR